MVDKVISFLIDELKETLILLENDVNKESEIYLKAVDKLGIKYVIKMQSELNKLEESISEELEKCEKLAYGLAKHDPNNKEQTVLNQAMEKIMMVIECRFAVAKMVFDLREKESNRLLN